MKDTDQHSIDRIIMYITSLPDFEMADSYLTYNHMGATISDSILQAGINYENVVRPRVQHILKTYPQTKTTSEFLRLLNDVGPEKVLLWEHPEKSSRAVMLATFFQEEGIESEVDLANWLEIDENQTKLMTVRGIGPKTVDYSKILSGMNTAAVDRHMYAFLGEAGIQVQNYDEAKKLLNSVADEMDVHRGMLDHSIWSYMSIKAK